jgi:hypothetical protein
MGKQAAEEKGNVSGIVSDGNKRLLFGGGVVEEVVYIQFLFQMVRYNCALKSDTIPL